MKALLQQLQRLQPLLKYGRNALAHLPWSLALAVAIVYIIYINLAAYARQTVQSHAVVNTRANSGEKPDTDRPVTEIVQADADIILGVGVVTEPTSVHQTINAMDARSIPWQAYYLAGFAALAFGGVYLFYRLSTRLDEYEKDRDPDELRKLFEEFAPQIGELGTPRRLKRFSNRLRFQFNLLQQSGHLKTPQETNLFFRLMINAEQGREKFLLPYSEFIHTFHAIRDTNDALLWKIYEFNRQIQV